VHVDDGSETESEAKKLNRQKVLLASMRPTRPVKNDQKYGVRARTADSSIWYDLSGNPFSLSPPFHNNFPELTFQMKAHIRSLISIVKENRKRSEEEEHLMLSLAVYSRKLEM
jgi:hypothetical protein